MQQSKTVKEQTLSSWSRLGGGPQHCFPSLHPNSDLSARTPGKLRPHPPWCLRCITPGLWNLTLVIQKCPGSGPQVHWPPRVNPLLTRSDGMPGSSGRTQAPGSDRMSLLLSAVPLPSHGPVRPAKKSAGSPRLAHGPYNQCIQVQEGTHRQACGRQ